MKCRCLLCVLMQRTCNAHLSSALVHCIMIHPIAHMCSVLHACPAHSCIARLSTTFHTRVLYCMLIQRTCVAVMCGTYTYITVGVYLPPCLLLLLLTSNQLTADIHTTATTSHSKPLACPPPPEEYGGWATGWRRAPTLHPLAMPDTWQSGRVHIAHLPPPKETGGGRDQRCNGG